MPDTLNIPGIGPMNKKYVLIGAAGIAGFVGFAYYRARQSAASTTTSDATSSDTSATDTTDTTAYDPAYDYGAYGTDYGSSYMGSSPYYSPPFGSSTPIGTGVINTDSAWVQAAVQNLEGVGVEASAASHAIGLYMSDQCGTAQDADYVRQATSLTGMPPQTHHDFHVCPASGDGGGTPPPPTKIAPTNFRVTSTDKSGVTVSWDPTPGAKMYLIHIGGGPQKYNHSVSDSAPPYRFGALSKSSTYSFNIRAIYSDGEAGPASATISGKTKAK